MRGWGGVCAEGGELGVRPHGGLRRDEQQPHTHLYLQVNAEAEYNPARFEMWAEFTWLGEGGEGTQRAPGSPTPHGWDPEQRWGAGPEEPRSCPHQRKGLTPTSLPLA